MYGVMDDNPNGVSTTTIDDIHVHITNCVMPDGETLDLSNTGKLANRVSDAIENLQIHRDVKLISISNLTSHTHSFTVGSSKGTPVGAHGSSETSEMLMTKNYILLGKLVVRGEYLSIEDSTGHICCVIPKDQIQVYDHINQYVLLLNFNYIFCHGTEVYLELTYTPAFLSSAISRQSKCIDIIGGSQVSLAIMNREMFKESVLNIKVKIDFISEIFSVKRDRLCVISFSNCDLVLRNRHLIWQKFIVPGQEYIFTHLKVTTLKKGASSSRSVFVLSSQSNMYFADSCSYRKMEIGHYSSTKTDHTDTQPLSGVEIVSSNNKMDNFLNYQGKITSTTYIESGVIELDNELLLYLCCLPPQRFPQSLRVGCVLEISNAHLNSPKTDSRDVVLFPCMRTSIKIAKFSNADDCQSSPFIPALDRLNSNVVPYRTIVMLVDTWIHISKYLHMEGLQKNCLLDIYSNILPVLDVGMAGNMKRNLMEELLCKHHECFSNITDNNVCTTTPDLIPIKKMLATLLKLQDEEILTMCRNQPTFTQSVDEQLYWNYIENNGAFSNNLVLGQLETSNKTGRLYLRDSSGSIDVVCCSRSLGVSHACDSKCTNSVDDIRCPFPQLKHRHAVICVPLVKCKLVCEKFLVSDNLDSVYTEGMDKIRESRYTNYIQFSMMDAIVLKYPSSVTDGRNPDIGPLTGGHKPLYTGELKRPFCYDILIMTKSDATVDKFVQGNRQKLKFSVKACVSTCAHGCKGRDSNPTESEPNNKRKQIDGAAESSGSSSTFLIFHDSDLKYFQIIHPSASYHLITTEAMAPQKCVSIKNCALETGRTLTPSTFRPSTIIFQAVEEILDNTAPAALINLRCIIVKRFHRNCQAFEDLGFSNKNSRIRELNIGLPGNKLVVLKVRDLKDSRRELQVVLNFRNSVYTLGLLPGSCIELLSLEARKMKSNVTCCFSNSVSGVRIIAVTATSDNERADTEHELQFANNGPIYHPAYLWNPQQGEIENFSCVVFVQRILTLFMKATCRTCGCIFGSSCTNRNCSSTLEPLFAAKLTCLVDAGTFVGVVKLGNENVRNLLRLSKPEWDCVKNMVIESSQEINYTQQHKQTCEIEWFIAHICDDHLIRRSWVMTLSTAAYSRVAGLHETDIPGIQKMGLDQFSLKDISDMREKTRSLPVLQFQGLEIRPPEPYSIALSVFKDT